MPSPLPANLPLLDVMIKEYAGPAIHGEEDSWQGRVKVKVHVEQIVLFCALI